MKPTAEKGRRPWIKKTLVSIINIVVLILLISNAGYLGLLYYAILFVIWQSIVNREQILLTMRSIETMIFGKPLERSYWKKGEFKNRPKVRIVWKKKKQ